MPYVLDIGLRTRCERTWMSSEVNILDMSARNFSAFHQLPQQVFATLLQATLPQLLLIVSFYNHQDLECTLQA